MSPRLVTIGVFDISLLLDVPARKTTARPIRLAILAMHPVQYHSPLYRSICGAPAFDGKVLYLDTVGLKGIYDKEFDTRIEWDVPLLEGHDHAFIANRAWNNKCGPFSRLNPGLPAALKRGAFDVILIQGYSIASFWIALFAARRLGIKVVWRGEVTLKPSDTARGFKQRARDALVQAFLRRCDALLYTCAGNKDFLVHQGFREDDLFPFICAVDNDHFRSELARYAAHATGIRHDLGIPDENVVVLFCGRLTPRKRPADALEAIRRAGAERISFVIMGDGPQREELLGFARANAIHTVHLGFVNQSEIGRYYSIADIFCLLSEYDPSPKALNEAMNFSLVPIVSETIGTSRDLILDGETGFRVGLGDVDAIASLIRRLRDEPATRAQIAEAAQAHVAQLSFAANVAGLEQACRYALRHGTAANGVPAEATA